MNWEDPTVQGAIIGVGGSIAGVVVAFAFSVGRDWLSELRDRRRIGTVLYQELFDQAQAVALCASYVNAFNFVSLEEKRSRIERVHLDFHAPADPIVFEGCADRLHILGAAAGTLVLCYAAIKEAKQFANLLPETLSGKKPDVRLDMLQARTMLTWRRACLTVADALDALRLKVDGPSGPYGEIALANLVGNLRNLSEGDTLAGNPTDDPAHLQDD